MRLQEALAVLTFAAIHLKNDKVFEALKKIEEVTEKIQEEEDSNEVSGQKKKTLKMDSPQIYADGLSFGKNKECRKFKKCRKLVKSCCCKGKPECYE